MTSAMREKAITALGGALLLIVILAAYANHFHNGFHYDDGHTIVNNVSIRDLRNIPLFFRDATTFSTLPSNQSYRPLVSTLLAIDYRLGRGLQPFWFHLSIFTLFLALTLLLAFVVRHLLGSNAGSSSNRWIALGAAAYYALNPANADAINYIIVVAEVISALGVIASFALYFVFPRFRAVFSFCSPGCDRHPSETNGRDLPRSFRSFSFVLSGLHRRAATAFRAGLVPGSGAALCDLRRDAGVRPTHDATELDRRRNKRT